MPPAKFRSHKCKLLSQQILKGTEAMNKIFVWLQEIPCSNTDARLGFFLALWNLPLYQDLSNSSNKGSKSIKVKPFKTLT